MALPKIYLLQDGIEHLKSYVSGAGPAAEDVKLRQAVEAALVEMPLAHRWQRQQKQHRIYFDAPYSTGTLEYAHSTKIVTFSTALSSTVQGWAQKGRLLVDNVIADVKTYTDSTHVVLDDTLNFGADVAAETEFTLFRSQYDLPSDFLSLGALNDEGRYWAPRRRSLDAILAMERANYNPQGDVLGWCIERDPDNWNKFVLRIVGYPAAARTLDFVYSCQPRETRYSGFTSTSRTASTQLLTCSASVNVSAAAAFFESGMVGSYISFGNTTGLPDSIFGASPFAERARIKTFSSTTAVVLEAATTGTYTAVYGRVSDPLEIDFRGWNLFCRCAEWQLDILRRYEPDAAEAKYRRAAKRAGESDDHYDRPASGPLDAGIYDPHGLLHVGTVLTGVVDGE